jgi:hypothetical protein
MSKSGKRSGRDERSPGDLIAYSGLYCGDCLAYRQRVADLARDLGKELRQCRSDKTAAAMQDIGPFRAFAHCPQCYGTLAAMVKLRCRRTCRGEVGPLRCSVRACARKNGLDGCWQCEGFTTCGRRDFVKANHGGAHLKNLRKLSRGGSAAFIKGPRHWYTKTRNG